MRTIDRTRLQSLMQREQQKFVADRPKSAMLFERATGLTKLRQIKTLNIVGYPLVRTRARFLKPTRFGDDVTVESTITFGRSSFEVEHKLSLNGETCVECSEKRVWVVRDPNGKLKSQAIPDAVRKKFVK